MSLHYHGTPITPRAVLLTVAGNCFCVRHGAHSDVRVCHEIGQSVMLDNGAYSKFTKGKLTDWPAYYLWCDRWLHYPTTWAVIPDVIGEGGQMQDALLAEWPHGERGAPVWHSDEPIDRLIRLSETWPKVCIGSTGEHWRILSDAWCARMDEAWNALAKHHRRTPWIHMLRGMQLATKEWPFASMDSTDLAQNHHRNANEAKAMADRWNAANPPATWTERPAHPELSLASVSAVG